MTAGQFSWPFIAGMIFALGLRYVYRIEREISWIDLGKAALCQAITFIIWWKVTI